MASLVQIKKAAEDLLADWWPAFTAWQESYKNDPIRSPNSRYWQGVLWPKTLPDDGVAVTPPDEETDYYPSSQDPYPLPWRTVVQEVVAAMVDPHPYWTTLASDLDASLPPSCDVSVQVDEYLTPTGGVGFNLYILFRKNGTVWRYALGVGSQAGNLNTGWQDVTPPPPLPE